MKHHAFLILMIFFVQSCADREITDDASPTSVEDESALLMEAPEFDIYPAASSGTFPDPFPVRPWLLGNDKYFYSTHAKILHCNGPVSANSFTQAGPVNINNGILQQYIDSKQIKIAGYWAKSVYRDNAGNWHMVASPNIKNGETGWTIITHMKPQAGEQWSPGNPIRNWVINKVLKGKPLTPGRGNYAGKYYKGPDGVLYLIYVRRLPRTLHNAVCAQRMKSTIEVNEDYDPVTLVGPEHYNSEFRNGTSGKKLLETGNLMRISGKYVLAYTVGDYVDDNYKLGIAWSDNLLGPYKKILKKDVNNIWKNGAGEPEVQYLLQAQKTNWPNYVKGQVKAPGVPSINRDSNGKWYLFFAGLPPSATKNDSGKYRAKERMTYFVGLNMNIPSKSVSNATNYELQNWITCRTR